VIRINPLARAGEPTAIAAIADRRNELPGNLSLQQELYFIGKVNQWADWLGDLYRHIEVRERALDLASKLDRRAGFITALQHEGRHKAQRFLAGLPG